MRKTPASVPHSAYPCSMSLPGTIVLRPNEFSQPDYSARVWFTKTLTGGN